MLQTVLPNAETNTAIKLLIMNKKIYASAIIIVILLGRFFRERISFDKFGLLTFSYFLILTVLGILFLLKFKPHNKRLFVWFAIYIIAFVGITLYYFFKS